uniref:Uncharacterized protein n=1 Tax=Cannabis sativa TaxID=3483 RepID=A0A803NI14_CANSA
MDLDFEDVLCSPSGSSKQTKKRTTSSKTASGSNLEPLKRVKKSANKKRALTQLTIDLEKTPDTSSIPAAVSYGEQALGPVHQVKFSVSQLEMAFLEPSYPYPPLQASLLSFVAQQRGLQNINQLNTELHKSNDQRKFWLGNGMTLSLRFLG